MPGIHLTDRRLVTLPISPFSERAKWALDHHRLPYQTIVHVPFMGESRLRRLIGSKLPADKRATVPVLLVDHQVFTESWDIALHADREGKESKLIPTERQAEVRKWNDLADETMDACRALVVSALLENPLAIDEGLPRTIPNFIKPVLRPIGRYGMRWFARKYGARLDDAPAQLAKLRITLAMLRAALAHSGSYLCGSFSYADIVMASCLQGISPVDDSYIRLGPATRQVWTRAELAREYADLIAWRDKLYEQHRKK